MSPEVQYQIESKMLKAAQLLMPEIKWKDYLIADKGFVKFHHHYFHPITTDTKFHHWLSQPFSFLNEEKDTVDNSQHLLILYNKEINPTSLFIRDSLDSNKVIYYLDKNMVEAIVFKANLEESLTLNKELKLSNKI